MLTRNLSKLASTSFEVVIIGGGIYGACIAREAALRGLKTALLEKADFGHATSANSLKVVHGGLRYLQHADILRMRRSINERRAMMRIAPHLVHPLPCCMPIYGHGLKGREAMALALLVNDLISFDRNKLDDRQKHLPRGSVISREACLEMFPGLVSEGLSGGAIWYDAQMYHSERLTLSFVLSAVEEGAEVANYLKVTDLVHERGRVKGVEVRDELSGESFRIDAQIVINAAGPWVDKVLQCLPAGGPEMGVRLAKAVNVATRPLFGRFAVGIPSRGDSPMGERLFFVTPWRDQALIGTTYALYEGNPDDLRVHEEDVVKLLEQVNAVYPAAELTVDDVLYTYCGLVPVGDVDERTGSFKREGQYRIRNHVHDGYEGLISVLGVKYTTARNIAEKVLDQVHEVRGETPKAPASDQIALFGGDIEAFEPFVQSVLEQRPRGLEASQLRPLLHNYGTAYHHVLDYMPSSNGEHDTQALSQSLLQAQVVYSVRHEMAQKLGDVVFRRTEMGTDGLAGQEEVVAFCADVMADELGWDEARRQQEIEEVKEMPVLFPRISEDKKSYERNLASTII